MSCVIPLGALETAPTPFLTQMISSNLSRPMTSIISLKWPFRGRSISFLGIGLCLLVSACSSARDVAPGTAGELPIHSSSEARFKPDVSIEQLEAESSFLSDLDQESRAVEFSRLWYEHGSSLEQTSYTGAFSAFARSAHTAIEPLLGDRCRNPFHPPCAQLDLSYKRAVDGLVSLLARNAWRPPDLGRTRYGINADTVKALEKLGEWTFTNDTSPMDPKLIRPGLGLPTVACRPLKQNKTACSPLTFVVTFSTPLSSETSTLSLRAFDAYQQEIVTIDSTQLPLAAAIDQTATTIGNLAQANPGPALYCLSLPTAETATIVTVVENAETLSTVKNILIPLLKDDALRLTSSFCVHTIGESISDSRTVRSIVDSLRASHSATNNVGIGPSPRLPLRIIAIGERAVRVAVLLANRASRRIGSRNRRTTVETIFKTHGIITIGRKQVISGDAITTDFPTISFEAPCDSQCLSGVKKSLYDTTPAFQESFKPVSPEQEPTETEGLDLSPII